MPARTGLWEPWVSNHPGPPGPRGNPNNTPSQVPAPPEVVFLLVAGASFAFFACFA